MKKNMGNSDRAIRLVIALAVAILYFSQILTGTVGLILMIAAGIFFFTSMISFCPLYAPFGISTCRVKKRD
jgi:uncharacterized membrane protein YccC